MWGIFRFPFVTHIMSRESRSRFDFLVWNAKIPLIRDICLSQKMCAHSKKPRKSPRIPEVYMIQLTFHVHSLSIPLMGSIRGSGRMWTVVKTELTVKESGLQGIKKTTTTTTTTHSIEKKVDYEIQHAILVDILKGTRWAMWPRWPGHYFCQFEKRLPQPEIKCTRRIHLEIRFNLA